jgi:heme A synthase
MSLGNESVSWKPLRLSIVATLVLLTLQGWTGDFVNVFVTTSTKNEVSQSLGGFFQTVVDQGPFLIWHAMEGILIVLSGIGVLVVSLRYKRRSVRLASALGLLFVLLAGLGGYLFVISGFSQPGSTMQMGGSFLGAYAFYFITLYYMK